MMKNYCFKIIQLFVFIGVGMLHAQTDKVYKSLDEALANPTEVYHLDL
jgi:hypothetical protein